MTAASQSMWTPADMGRRAGRAGHCLCCKEVRRRRVGKALLRADGREKTAELLFSAISGRNLPPPPALRSCLARSPRAFLPPHPHRSSRWGHRTSCSRPKLGGVLLRHPTTSHPPYPPIHSSCCAVHPNDAAHAGYRVSLCCSKPQCCLPIL